MMCNDIDKGNVTPFPAPDVCAAAVEKIDKELKAFQGGTKEKAVSAHVAATIQNFCGEDERFASVVCRMKRTLTDCCAEIMKGCGSSISDIEVYRRAAKFYFPNAEVDFKMNITVSGDAPSTEELDKAPAPLPKPATKPAPAAPRKPIPAKPAKEKPQIIQLSLF